MIHLKSPEEIDVIARGGAIIADFLVEVRPRIQPGISTLQVDSFADEFIRSHAGALPAFKGLYGFPGSVCTSLNEEVVHGIPKADRVLEDGDIISGGNFHGQPLALALDFAAIAVSEIGNISERRVEQLVKLY